MAKESPEKDVRRKSYDENGGSSIELIRITPFGVSQISKQI
jgi:hypothetical protein